MENSYYVGIDVSKETLDFSVVQSGQQIFYVRVSNSEKGMKEFFRSFAQSTQAATTSMVFCMEHTGIYNFHALEYLSSIKAKVWIESATKIKRSLGLQRGKNDKVDSLRIAQYAYKNREEIKLWEAPRQVVRELKQLLTMRQRCVTLKKQARTPIVENSGFNTKKEREIEMRMFKHTLKALEKDLVEIEHAIHQLIEGDENLKHLFKLVTSVDGIGSVVATHMIVLTNEFRNFANAKKFACYSGIAPFEHTSGKSIRGKSRVSHMANKQMKSLFHMAALSSIRLSGELTIYFNRQVEKGKNKMLVLNAIRNKLVHRIFAVVRQGVPYQKDYNYSLAMS
jgi:transposase